MANKTYSEDFKKYLYGVPGGNGKSFGPGSRAKAEDWYRNQLARGLVQIRK